MSPRSRVGDPGGAWREPSARSTAWALAAITLLALALRLHRLGSDLWLDEIAPVLLYGDLSPLEVLRTYRRPNNHLLNTVLVNASTGLFGRTEWAIRLPAALFGTATVPVVYGLARRSLARSASLGAALLVAVSYHHVFFSQSARGYAAYLLFSVAAAGCLLRLLETGRARWAVLHATALSLALAAVPLAAFVVAAHAVLALALLGFAARRGERIGGRAAGAAAALAGAAAGGALLYAPIAGRVLATVRDSYSRDRIGFSFTSPELLEELTRSLSVGLGAGVLLVGLAVAALAAAGLVRLGRRDPGLVGALALPVVLMAVALGATGSTFYPRFFLLALPLGLLALVHGVLLGAGLAVRSRPARAVPLAAAGMALVAVASALSLVPYYRVPKQSYSAALELLEREAARGAKVVVLDTATGGFRFYSPAYDLREGHDLFYVRSEEDLEALVRAQPVARLRLVTTFPASLRTRFPSWSRCLGEGWETIRVFPASVGGGEIRVWRFGGAGVEWRCIPTPPESSRP